MIAYIFFTLGFFGSSAFFLLVLYLRVDRAESTETILRQNRQFGRELTDHKDTLE